MADTKPKIEEKEEKPLNKDVESLPKKSFKDKLADVRDNITVEPLLAGLIIPSVLNMFAMVNLNLDKACRVNLNYSNEVCDALIKRDTNYSAEEREVQKLISSIDIWRSVLRTLLPCIIIMFLGAWSDRTGRRKICILLPVFGEFLTSINNLINVYFFYEIPVEITVFMETIFGAMTGGWVTMFLGVFSYISDITSEETRTFRVGMVNFCMTVGLPIGIGMSGILLQKMGYYGVFSMTGVLFVVVLLYGTFCLKEPDQVLKEKGLPPIERSDSKKVSFFDISHVVATVAVAFRKRASNRRVKVLLTLFAVFVLYGPTMSEHGILYLFVRNRLNWDMVKYGLYTSYSIVLHSFGAMFSITVLSKRLQVDDSLLCLISVSSKFVGGIWTAFVQSDIEMYLVPVVEILNATTFTSLRSIISKLVEKQETAKINSLFSLTETVANLIFHPFYAWMYMKTLQTMSGAVFLVSASLIVPAAIILIIFYSQHRKELGKARKKALEAEEKIEADIKKIDILNPYFIHEKLDKINVNAIKDKLDVCEKKEDVNASEKKKHNIDEKELDKINLDAIKDKLDVCEKKNDVNASDKKHNIDEKELDKINLDAITDKLDVCEKKNDVNASEKKHNIDEKEESAEINDKQNKTNTDEPGDSKEIQESNILDTKGKTIPKEIEEKTDSNMTTNLLAVNNYNNVDK